MKRLFYIIFIILSVSIYARIGEMKVNPTTSKPKIAEIVCCEINYTNLYNEIRINKICLGKGKTVIEFEFLKPSNACTILESNIMIDDKGKQYSPTYHSGLANCPDITKSNTGRKFYWGFENLDKSAKSLKLKEDEKYHPNMIAMQWTQFSIEHCKW